MRWVKHLTSAHHDEKMARLVADLGLEGYGFYWIVLETVAGQIEAGSDRTSVCYPVAFWRKTTGFSLKKLRIFVENCADLGIISADFSENSLTISIPNILKYRDEWSRRKGHNSGVAPEQLRSKDSDTDTEEEKDIKAPPSPSERPPVGAVHHSDQPDLLTASPAEPAPKPKRAPSSSQRFTPPTVDEVAEYCRERGNAVDAEQWHAHYTANGWRVGKNPMKDWRAAVRTWERNAHGTPKPQTRDGPPMPMTYRECQDAERRQTAEDWLRRRGLMDDGEQAGDLGRAPGAATALRVIDADFRTQG